MRYSSSDYTNLRIWCGKHFSVVKNMFRSTRPLRIEFLHLLFFLNKYDIWSTAPAPNLQKQELGIWGVPLGKLTSISFIEPAP